MASQEQPEPEPSVSEQLRDLEKLASEEPFDKSSTYSESLTCLQTGYLHCISVLEAQKEALRNELKEARANAASEVGGEAPSPANPAVARNKPPYEVLQLQLSQAQRKTVEMRGQIVQLENRLAARQNLWVTENEANELLQHKLADALKKPVKVRSQIQHLQSTLAVKNEKLYVKNKEIFELSQALNAAKKGTDHGGNDGTGHGDDGGAGGGSRKLGSAQGKRKWGPNMGGDV